MSTPLAIQIAQKAITQKAAQPAPWTPPNTPEWTNPQGIDMNAWQQNEANKPQGNQPMWVQYGFPDTPEGIAAYNNIYNPPAPTPGPLIGDQNQGSPIPTNGGGYDTTTPFGKYLADNQGNRDTWATTQKLLGDYGLEGMFDWAQNELIQGRSENEVTIDMMNQQGFKDRFPIIDQMKKAGLPAWAPGDIVSYEKAVTGTMQSAGLPAGFYDDPVTDIQQFIAKGISAAEIDQRIVNGYSAVMQQPQDVKDQWYALGYTTGDLVAHFLDPDKTEALLTKQQAATQRAAEAKRAGYGQLSTAEADWMAGAGISADASQQGFTALSKEQELFGALPGEAGNGISREQQLAAQFQGNAAAQSAIDQKAKERVAQVAGGGGYTQGQDGRTGIGSAR